jgi:hypothetical protein
MSDSYFNLKQPSYKSALTIDSIFVFLCQQKSWISDVEIAVALDSSIPVTRKLLVELGDVVESDRSGNWRIVQTVTTEVVSNCDRSLSIEEKQELLSLERTIERGFYLAGLALKQLRDRRLYRESYATFEIYCRDRFDFTRATAYYLIGAAKVIENLKCQQFVDIFPTKESQCRPLMTLPPEKQKKVWLKAIEQAKGKVPSASIVKSVVAEIEGNQLDRCLKKTSSTKQSEGLNYRSGLGCEWYVKVEQSIYQQLMDYQAKKGLPTLNSTISNLLELVEDKN